MVFLGLAGNPGMQGERGTLIYEIFSMSLIPGDKGPKGFSGREGDMGSIGYLCVYLFSYLIIPISFNSYYNTTTII